MNFIVRSLEDIDFGALPGVLAALDILQTVNTFEIFKGSEFVILSREIAACCVS
jgi:hypothetical protein